MLKNLLSLVATLKFLEVGVDFTYIPSAAWTSALSMGEGRKTRGPCVCSSPLHHACLCYCPFYA